MFTWLTKTTRGAQGRQNTGHQRIVVAQRLNDANIAKLLPGASRAEDGRGAALFRSDRTRGLHAGAPRHRFARQALKQRSRSARKEQWGELLAFRLRGSTYPPA